MAHTSYSNTSGRGTTMLPSLPIGPDPLLALIQAYKTEVDIFNSSDDRPDDVMDALWSRLAYQTPPCTSDEGVFAALALVARERMDSEPSDLTEALLAAVVDYAGWRDLDS